MNSPRGDVLLAVLLVIAGHLGVIARALTDTALFGLMGLASFVFAVAVLMGMLIRQFRVGASEPSEKRQRPSAEYLGTIDGAPVPEPGREPRKRARAEDYRSLE